ncbi:Transcriptional regulatory protein DegU [bacterium HR28]|nr:Transcriptional regulatory protein DegU [bacterium HR28]
MAFQSNGQRRADLPTASIADPQAAVRQSLRHYLESTGAVRVLAETGDLAQLASLLEWQPPQILLLSGHFGMSLPRFVRIVRRGPVALALDGSRVLRVVVYGLGGDRELVLALARAGVDGLVADDASLEELVEAIRIVLRGESYASARYGGLLLRELQRWSVLQEGQPGVRLTRRETQLLQLVASGLSNKEIAEALCLAESTVKNRLSLLFDKLGVKDRTQAAIFALANGVLQQPFAFEQEPLAEA